jgi:hypothetical protein
VFGLHRRPSHEATLIGRSGKAVSGLLPGGEDPKPEGNPLSHSPRIWAPHSPARGLFFRVVRHCLAHTTTTCTSASSAAAQDASFPMRKG